MAATAPGVHAQRGSMHACVCVRNHATSDVTWTLLQTQQVGLRVKDGAEALIGAVRRFFCDGDTIIIMLGDTSNAGGSSDWFAVPRAVRRHAPQLAQLCALQFEKGTKGLIQERRNQGERQGHGYEVSVGVGQGSTQSMRHSA